MKLVSKLFKVIVLLVIVYAVPLLTLYLISETTDLPGRRAGPKDAFRHTFASAVVSRYISASAVELFTHLTERKADSSYDQMDVHNNMLGARIGSAFARGDLQGSMYSYVLEKVRAAQTDAQSLDIVRVLSADKWNEKFCASCNW